MKVTRMSPFSQVSRPIAPAVIQSRQNTAELPKEIFGLNFSNFKKDDWLLLGIIAVLIMEGSTDYVLLCALGYLFIVGL
ncbi:MAG: hypothetical protein IJ316_04205 [Clostridia bacterium]|nr:hypothetical protein [Clostridia bacterium]